MRNAKEIKFFSFPLDTWIRLADDGEEAALSRSAKKDNHRVVQRCRKIDFDPLNCFPPSHPLLRKPLSRFPPVDNRSELFEFVLAKQTRNCRSAGSLNLRLPPLPPMCHPGRQTCGHLRLDTISQEAVAPLPPVDVSLDSSLVEVKDGEEQQ